ncbi:relaxase/mobilization nuclease domain-containing protein, partial [Duncaniella muris]|uniref:relaxase/mobilization nuclease domain-containing protein n=1 Tax=Duncaniella muris TaxID=2094150 RepID=UPI00272D5E24
MIAYIINGKSFGNCVDYVTRRALEEKLHDEQSKRQKSDERKNESNNGADIIDHLSKDWQLLAATTDVRIYEGRKAMADDIARPTRRRKPIKDPVGHISLDFHPADAPRMTDELMAAVAQDYMKQMRLTNTPYIVVRHYDKAHPHCHIVFSRVDYDGKILTQTTNFKKNERVCKALNLKHRLMQGKSKLNTDVSKLRGKEKVRYQLVHDLAGFYLTPSVTDWNSYIDLLRRNGITVREKIGKSGRVNLYYGVGKHEFWYKKLDPFLSRENLELKFKARRENKQAAKAQPQTSPKSQSQWQSQPQSQPKPQPNPKQPDSIVIPPLPDVVCGVKIDRPRQQAYQDGQIISIGICEPGGVVPLTHWIWYDFDKREPVISWAYPSDNKIPEAFQRQLAAKQSPASSSQGAG